MLESSPHPGWRAATTRLVSTCLLALAGVTPALGQSVEEQRGDLPARLATSAIHSAVPPGRGTRARAGTAARATGGPFYNTIWLGHSVQTVVPGTPSTYSFGPWHIGRGNNHPSATGSAADNSGVWTWNDWNAGESDSLQGWWPMRRAYSTTGALTLNDVDRPWWAVDVGNQGNYVMNSAQGRTFGVLSYWHADGGNKSNPPPFNGNALPAMTWAPLAGNASAWCGLRNHGDFFYADPITGNPYNASVLETLGENGGLTSGPNYGTNKKLPGYPGQMDQMLYRDLVIDAPTATLDLSFLYRTAMSTATTTSAITRTGWFQFDPTIVGPVAVAGPNAGVPNYISNTGIGQPADSFMVYLGVPVDIDDLYLADGSHKVAGATPHGVFDLRRRWLSEVLALDKPIAELLHVAGNTNTSFGQTGLTLASFYNAQAGPTHTLRIVFRAKTNRGTDDLSGSSAGAFSSGGVGAVLVDQVAIGGSGISGAAVGTSGFESPGEIDNAEGPDPGHALAAWRATGKPPAIYFHPHPLEGGNVGGGNVYAPLLYEDICGPPGAAGVPCAMKGVVISAGDHDHGEVSSGTSPTERERMDGLLSPTILLASSGPNDYNACGLDTNNRYPQDDYYLWSEVYSGIFNLLFTGAAYTFGAQSYPGKQSDGVRCWGELRDPGFQVLFSEIRCQQDWQRLRYLGLVRTSNTGGIPDSIRIFLGKNCQCFRFGITPSECPSSRGAYFDNVSFLISNDCCGAGGLGGPIVDSWRWLNDTFPANDGASPVPGVAVQPGTAAFDTAAAFIKSGFNSAPPTTDLNRSAIPGDSVVAIALNGGVDRLDLVFRILPGVGNYHVVGDPSSGLRPVPTDPVNVVAAGDNSFWGQYLASPGTMSKGVHGNPGVAGPGGGANWWNKNVWDSARCDTADVNIFPVQSNGAVFDITNNFNNFATWMACYHESDPKYATLGIPHNRCFLVNPAGVANSTNITCSGAPGGYAAAQGYDGVPTTKEGTKIIPDGLLTPGAHVQYFFRLQNDGPRDDLNFDVTPDTFFVTPQSSETSYDGHRWQQFGVLPDRWKDLAFGGQGMACMLYVDQVDRAGNELAFVSLADTLGLTAAAKRGAHNGWRARGDQPIVDAYGFPLDISHDASIARYDHGGQPGTVWDMFGVKGGVDSPAISAGHLGDRMGAQATGLAAGKDARFGPTPAMLRTYYKVLLFLTGDLVSGIFGRFVNNGQDDIALLDDFLRNPAPGDINTTRRALIAEGSGFVQSETATGSMSLNAGHLALLRDDLGVTLRAASYSFPSGNFAPLVGLTNAAAGPIPGGSYSLASPCTAGNDVLAVAPGAAGGVPASYYENAGLNGPYIASVHVPVQPGTTIYESFVDGWNLERIYNTAGTSTTGRFAYYMRLLSQVGGFTGCQLTGPCLCTLDVPGEGERALLDFMRLANNPLERGEAVITFGLGHTDRVTARIYDLAGREVRRLADRAFAAGPHELRWDGADDQGRRLARGVYFVRLRYAAARFDRTTKLIVLR